MNRAVTTCLIWIALCVDFLTGLSTCEMQRWEGATLEAFCRTMNKPLWKELGDCEKDFEPYAGGKFLKCKKEADPQKQNGGGIHSHIEAICGSGSVMGKYRACLNKVFVDQKFLEKFKCSRKARKCIVETLKKYNLYSTEVDLRENE